MLVPVHLTTKTEKKIIELSGKDNRVRSPRQKIGL